MMNDPETLTIGAFAKAAGVNVSYLLEINDDLCFAFENKASDGFVKAAVRFAESELT